MHERQATSNTKPNEGFVRPIPISEAIFRHLGQEIIQGRLGPGERLLETKLCEELGCSRSPLREAFRMLAAENLVTIEPRRGARVAHLTEKGIANLFEVRIELEALSVSLASERATTDDIAVLERLNAEMAATVENRDPAAYFSHNAQFHLAIARAADNEYLETLIRSANDRSFLSLFRTLSRTEHIVVSVAKHEELVTALRAGDGAEAARHMREHIATARDEALELIKKPPYTDAAG
jgi:DNA-binding GntR family transcriptional regulator